VLTNMYKPHTYTYIAQLNKCKINKIITKNVILILEQVPTGGYEMSFYIFNFYGCHIT